MGRFTTGVAIITSISDGKPFGMTVNSLTSVSLDPPLILFCAEHTSATLAAVLASRVFGVSILHEGQEDIARQFAATGPKSFEGIATHASFGGAPLLKDCSASLDCVLSATHDGGDHLIVVGEARAAEVVGDRPPLVFYRSGYHTLSP